MNDKNKFLEEIHALNGLQNAILTEISVTKRTKNAEFTLVTDKAYTVEEERSAQRICQNYLPNGFTASVRMIKRVPDETILRKKIYEYMTKKFPAAAAFLQEEDVEIELLQSGAHFYFTIASGDQSLFSSGRILDEVSAYLKTIFCGAFYGDVKIVEKERDDSLLDEEIPLHEIPERMKALNDRPSWLTNFNYENFYYL